MANVSKAPYNADLTGVEDSTKAIQDALYDVSLCGGGTVWMPAGTYRITGSIKIPAYVTLRGDWGDPGITEEYGTLVALDIPESDRHDTGTFTLGGCGGVYGLTVYYPNQSVEDVKHYPFTFYTAGADTESYLTPSVINCTVLNGYRGIGATTHSVARWEDVGHENMYVLNFRGTFLECGAECYNESDFGFWDDVKISTKYWMNAVRAGLLDPVDEERLKVYTKEHADGLILGDLDWVSLNNITVESCSVGIHIVPGKRPETDFQGLLYGISTTDCTRGMVVDALHPDIGMVLANSSIDDGLYNTTNTVIRMFNVEVNGLKEGRLREKAGKTGGVVYLPAGMYRLDAPVNVPAGVELKGTSAVPTRDFSDWLGYKGTTLLSYYKGGGPEDQALVTLNGEGAGLNGLRINYPENHDHSFKIDIDKFNTAYAVRGTAANVYIVNSYITSSAYGVDFTGCDGHCVKNLAACCYRNTLRLGGKRGVVCNCYQNPDMFYVTATPYVIRPHGNEHEIYEKLTRRYSDFLILEKAFGELIYNVATVGANRMLINEDSRVSIAINVSSDYMHGIQTVMNGGSLTVVNAMRYGGRSILHKKGLLKIYNRFEHGFSSGLGGDAIEETYVYWK